MAVAQGRVAVLSVALALLWRLDPTWACEALASWAFELISGHSFVIAVPVMFTRMVFKDPTERASVCILHQTALGIVALTLFEQLKGWQILGWMVVAHMVSFSFSCWLKPWVTAWGLMCSAGMAGAIIAVNHGHGAATVKAVAAVGASACCAEFSTARTRSRTRMAAALAALLAWHCVRPLGMAVFSAMSTLLPLIEFGEAYGVMLAFTGDDAGVALSSRLAFILLHTQPALGYVGIAYLREAQNRKLLLLDVGRRVTAKAFVQAALSFICTVGVAYFAQRR